MVYATIVQHTLVYIYKSKGTSGSLSYSATNPDVEVFFCDNKMTLGVDIESINGSFF